MVTQIETVEIFLIFYEDKKFLIFKITITKILKYTWLLIWNEFASQEISNLQKQFFESNNNLAVKMYLIYQIIKTIYYYTKSTEYLNQN